MKNRLFLIDGHALIFKMYYAFLRHPMINSKGVDTSILFGFTKYILELIEKEAPSHLAIAFDPPGGTFRHDMFSEYKATRDAAPQLVIDSLEPLCSICHALHIPVLMKKGYEADDVIGSIAKRAGNEGYRVYMVTPDKDYGQLITPDIIQYKPGKSGKENELIDVQTVCNKYGISTPGQVIEILTICGDAADNIPGVKGVGEVGAGKLIAKYGTVANIYDHIDELTPRQRVAFENAKTHIGLSHQLVTIKTDIEMDVDIEDMEVRKAYGQDAAELFDHYELGSLKKFLGDISSGQKAEESGILYVEADTTLICRIARKTACCAISVETSGSGLSADIDRIIVAVREDDSAELSCLAARGTADDFRDILEDGSIAKYGYELKSQMNILAAHKIGLEGQMMDIELMHYIVNPEISHKIDMLSKSYLDINLDGYLQPHEHNEPQTLFDEVPEENDDRSSFFKTGVTLLLGKKIWKEMEETGLLDLYVKIEEPLLRVLSRMEREGVKVDMGQLRRYAAGLAGELNQIQERVRKMAEDPELNIMSPRQIGVLLFEKLKLDPNIKPKKGVRYSYPTDEETLNALSHKHPIINEILEYRGIKKLLSTYIEPFPTYISPVTGKIHTTFNQALTATGRLSSSKPNLQNIPIRTERGKEIRKAFIPSRPDGFIVSADYSQIELRIMAHLSCDTNLIDAFRSGIDVHAMTAAKIFGISHEDVTPEQRRIAKTANFGIIYGISAFGLSQRLNIGRLEAKQLIEDYFANFPAISSYIQDTLSAARENGYVETLLGRRRYLPGINSQNGITRSLAERTAINAPIQGTSADIIKMAMVNVERRLDKEGLKSRMVLQIHDELLFDAVSDEIEILEKIVTEEMEKVITLSIPLTVECNHGRNWLEAH